MSIYKVEDVDVGMRVRFNYDGRFELIGKVIINRYIAEKFIITVDDWSKYKLYVGNPNILDRSMLETYSKHSDLPQDIESYINTSFVMVYYNEFVEVLDA